VPDLSVAVVDVSAPRFAVVPTLAFQLEVSDPDGPVHALALRCQVRVEPQLRRYDAGEEERLYDLFGSASRWADTLKPFLWAELSTVVPAFDGATRFELPMTCSYDFEVVANRYLHSLAGGEVPLVFLFSGSVFRVVRTPAGSSTMMVTPVPWHAESRFGLPVSVWREAMDRFFPGSGWLRLSCETIDALGRVKAAEALPTWDEAIRLLLKRAGEEQ